MLQPERSSGSSSADRKPVTLTAELARQLSRPLGEEPPRRRVTQRQRELFALLIGGRPDEIEARIASFEALLARFEDEHAEALAGEQPWRLRELRPYLLCRGEYAKALWLVGRRDEALEEIGVLLELQPADHLRLRSHLLTFLLAIEDWEGLRLELGQRGCGNASLAALLPLAIEVGEGDEPAARRRLAKLMDSHAAALSLWLGRDPLPIDLPLEAETGSREEALLAVALLRTTARPALVDKVRDLLTRVAGSKAWSSGKVATRAIPSARGGEQADGAGEREARTERRLTTAERLARIVDAQGDLEPEPLRHFALAALQRILPGAAGPRTGWKVEVRRAAAGALLEVASRDEAALGPRRVLARLAVELDPLQLDAQLLVARLSEDDPDRELYETRRALKVAEKAILPARFADLQGSFASQPATRRYLEVLDRLATLLDGSGRKDEAQAHRERIHKLDPSFAAADRG